jgi:hypothetical protein
MPAAIQHGYSPAEPRVLDWLLSSLARRLYGAVDLGLLSCLELPPPEYARFTARHFTEPMRALALVVRLAVSEAKESPPAGPLEGVYVWTESFVAALAAVGQFRSLPMRDLRPVAQALKSAWSHLHHCIRELAAALGLELSFTPLATPEAEQQYLALLDSVTIDLEAERGND